MALTYAIGDIHGALQKLQTLLARCMAHAAGRVSRFVFLGDYIDRGDDAAGVVRLIRRMQTQREVIALSGNHETMLLAVLDGALAPDVWLSQGGAETLRSYDVGDPADLPRDDVEWLRGRPLCHDDGRRLFVHAGVNPRRPLDAQDANDLLWIREPFLSDDRDYGRLIVHGHTPLAGSEPDLAGNRLNLDTAAVFGGPLTAAVFDDDGTPPIGFFQAS